MHVVHFRLNIGCWPTLFLVEVSIGFFGAADARRAGPHDHANPLRAQPALEVIETRQKIVLLEPKPGQAIVAADEPFHAGRQLKLVESVQPADPCIDGTAVKIIGTQPASPCCNR